MRYDVVVVGAGIHGASVARELSAAGYSCLVLERHPLPAQETSSRSSKLIHGGLRYLESGQFALVRECLRERERLLRTAPALVRRVPFLIPVYDHTTRRPWQIRIGLWLYRLLGGGDFRRVPRREWPRLDGLIQNGLQAVFEYQDAQTDDVALTHAVLHSARELGAALAFDATLVAARRDADGGYDVRYHQQYREQACRAGVLVNAAGPWVNAVLAQVQPAPAALAIDWVSGTHIEVARPPRVGVYYLEACDGRAVFVMPWGEHTLIGTTEVHQSSPDAPAPTRAEIDYLLATHNAGFAPALNPSDVISAFAGVRVLPGGAGSAFHRPRDTLVHQTDPQLITLYGGKLTSARATAAVVLERVRAALGPRPPRADTRTLPLAPYRFE